MKSLISALLIALLFSCNSSNECICTEEYAPVCGEDGRTYSNSCKAECEGVDYEEGMCPQRSTLTVRDQGPVGADGCGWVLELNSSTFYKPTNLDSTFYQDGLEMDLSYKLLVTTFVCGLAQTSYNELEITEIH